MIATAGGINAHKSRVFFLEGAMREEPENEALISRTEAVALARKHAAPQIQFLRELVNYGANLSLRAYESSQRETVDVIICGVLLKQVVAMLDASQILLEAGTVRPAFVSARAAFESSLYIDFILQKDSVDRARAVLVAGYREERDWCLRVIPGTTQSAAFNSQTSPAALDLATRRPTLAAEATQRATEITRHLEIPELKRVNELFEKKRGKKDYDAMWYTIFDVASVKALAKEVGREMEYVAFYSKGSKVVHGGSISDFFTSVRSGHGRHRHLRELDGLNHLVLFVGAVATSTFRRVLTLYRPGEVRSLDARYIENWREPMLGVPNIQTTYETTRSSR